MLHCLPNSAWADGSLAEYGVRADGTPCCTVVTYRVAGGQDEDLVAPDDLVLHVKGVVFVVVVVVDRGVVHADFNRGLRRIMHNLKVFFNCKDVLRT